MQPKRIEEFFQGFFQRNVFATLVLFVTCFLLFALAFWSREISDARRDAESFMSRNREYLLRIALYDNVEAIRLFLDSANSKSSKIRYTYSHSQNTPNAVSLFVGGKNHGYIEWQLKESSLWNLQTLLPISSFFLGVLILLLYFHIRTKRYLRENLAAPLELISSITRKASNAGELKKLGTLRSDVYEVNRIQRTLWRTARRIERHEEKLKQGELMRAAGLVNAIYSHNLRAPLTTLQHIVSGIENLTQDQDRKIKEIIGSIRYMSNQVLENFKAAKKGKAPVAFVSDPTVLFLPSIIEKCVDQIRCGIRKEIQLNVTWGLGHEKAFCLIHSVEFQGIIINLLNNAIEAIEGTGLIEVALSTTGNLAEIAVRDSGKGIPKEHLERLGEEGATFEKEGFGKGLGIALYHASETLKRSGGSLEFESAVGKGTTATIKIPLLPVPLWHPEGIPVSSHGLVVVIDDDPNQEKVWEPILRGANCELHSINSPDAFRSWMSKNSRRQPALFLVDFEFTGFRETGLDLIRQYQLHDKAILVTGMGDQESLQEECERWGVTLISKGTEKFIPVQVVERCADES